MYAGIKRYYEEHLAWIPLKIRALIVNSRPFTLLLPLLGGYFLIQASLPNIQIPTPDPIRTWIGLLALVLINMGGNNLNSVFDIEIDKINKPYRPLVRGLLSRDGVMLFAFLCFSFSLVLSPFIGGTFLVLCWSMILLTYFYSIPPIRLKRILWVNNITQAIIRGVLGPLSAWIIFGEIWDVRIWAFGSIMFTLIAPLQTTKDFPDVPGDITHGIKTLPIVYGVEKTVGILRVMLTIPFVLIGFYTFILKILPIESCYLSFLYPLSFLSVGMFKTTDKFENTLGWLMFYFIMLIFLLGFALTI